jgi:phosphoglycerol transferase
MFARRNAWPFIWIAVVATILMVLLKLSLSRLDVPYTFEGDAIDKLAQIENVAETGWLFHNERLGYPFGYDRLDFPRFDSLNYALMAPVAWTFGAAQAMNLYYLAGFYFIAFATFWSFRRLGLGTAAAALCALIYAFLPYHVLRGVHHLTNGAYFLVPFALLVLVELALDRLDTRPGDGRRRWIFALVLAVLLPLQMPYNGVFFAYLAVVAGAIAITRGAGLRGVVLTLSLLAATALAFIAEQTPVMLHALAVGKPTSVAERKPVEAEAYSLYLNQLLIPTVVDRRKSAAQAADAFAEALQVPSTEIRNQYIGAFGVLGFLALGWALCRAIAARAPPADTGAIDPEAAARVAAVLALAILLLAISTGLGTLIAYWITAKIRAYNRAAPFFAVACMFGAGWLVDLAMARIRRRWIAHAAFAVFAVAMLYDVLVRPTFPPRAAEIARYDQLRSYFAGVERQLGEHAAVLQLPAVWYPEQPPTRGLKEYEEFKPFLLTRTLRFSFGVGPGRPGYRWNRYVEAMDPPQMIAEAHAKGFAAILIATRAYDAVALADLTGALSAALSRQPMVSADREWMLFPLQGCCDDAPAAAPAVDPNLFPYTVGSAPLRFATGGRGTLYCATGWRDTESWGVWSSGTHASVRLRLDPAPRGPLSVALETRMVVGPKLPRREVAISANGKHVADAVYTKDAAAQTLHVELPAGVVGADGVLELVFDTRPAGSPRSAGISVDGRRLGVGLVTLSIDLAP